MPSFSSTLGTRTTLHTRFCPSNVAQEHSEQLGQIEAIGLRPTVHGD